MSRTPNRSIVSKLAAKSKVSKMAGNCDQKILGAGGSAFESRRPDHFFEESGVTPGEHRRNTPRSRTDTNIDGPIQPAARALPYANLSKCFGVVREAWDRRLEAEDELTGASAISAGLGRLR
jgi:hypothetical protein